jgi:creatinine amidohydrolase
MTASPYYSELAWPDLKRAAAGGVIVILPIGSTEQHGPQLPVCTDDLLAQRWAIDAASMARQAGIDVLVMPTIHYGNAQHHMGFAGTISLSFETLKNLTFEVGDCVLRHGFRKLVILNVHGGNRYAVRAAAVDLAVKYEQSEPPAHIRVAEDCDADLNPLLRDSDRLAAFTPEGRRSGMVHAGALETAKILHLAPEWVRMERTKGIDNPMSGGPETRTYAQLTDCGAMGRPGDAAAEAGRIMHEDLVAYLAEYLKKLAAS